MSPPIMNLVGQRFGRLAVVSLAERGGRRARWNCLCDCGNTKAIAAGELRKGSTVSCGCFRAQRAATENRKDIAGTRFGRLLVVKPDGSTRYGVRWACVCDCGSSRLATATELIGGRVISCGCAVFDKPCLTPRRVSARRAANCHARRARERAAVGRFTAEQIDRLYLLQLGRCASCRTPLNGRFHRDHRTALARGGSNGIDNIELLCRSCNSRKRDKDPIKWANENGRLL